MPIGDSYNAAIEETVCAVGMVLTPIGEDGIKLVVNDVQISENVMANGDLLLNLNTDCFNNDE